MNRYFLLLCALLTIGVASAQPVITYWPSGKTDGASAQPARRVAECERSANAVFPGELISFELDLSGGFDESVTLINADGLNRGTAEIVADSLLRYVAFPTITSGAFDTLLVERCDDEGDCIADEFVVAVGRRGTRRDTSFAAANNEVVRFRVDVPEGRIVCAEIAEVGQYEGANRRAVRFESRSTGRIRYGSSRQAGVDELQSVVCDEFGTCDTFDIRVSVAAITVALPFCDDFSGEAGLPNPDNWLDDDVFVNDAFGANPPTIGVATFDGIREGGQPYGEGRQLTDQLTSTFIDTRDNGERVFVKYFLQLGGFGQAPEDVDMMRVQGRNVEGVWEDLREPHIGVRNSVPELSFSFFSIPLDSADMRHERFQVRFQVESNGAGAFDIWNLDYVRVEVGDNGRNFDDIALATSPPSILAPYTAIPYSQFSASSGLNRTAVPVTVNNLFAETNNVSGTSLSVTDATGVTLLDVGLLSGAQFNLDPGFSRFVSEIPDGPLADFESALRGLSEDAASVLTTRYRLDIDTDQDQIACALNNDAAESVTFIGDYYAYDDGTAETGLSVGGVGERLVVEYEAFAEDTLRGLRFAFPRIGDLDPTRQLINLEVYVGALSDAEGNPREPDYQQIFVRPFFVSSITDSLQAFTTYRLEDEAGDPLDLIIPPGKFYVGWQQALDANNPVGVGFDVENNTADKIFSEYGFGWIPLPDDLPDFRGSLMIRPVFSSEPLQNSSRTRDFAEIAQLRVHPNPTDEFLYVAGIADAVGGRFELHDGTGRLVKTGDLRAELSLRQPAGLYVLTAFDGDGAPLGRARVVLR